MIIILLAITVSMAEASWRLVPIGSVSNNGSPHDVFVSGGYAYLGDWDVGLSIINVVDPYNPERVSLYNTDGLANSTFMVGNTIFEADWSRGINIFDVSTPLTPIRLSNWESPGTAYNLYPMGNYLYMADFNRGLQILDITSLIYPVAIGSYLTGGFACGVWGSGNNVYVASSASGLVTFDVTNPDSAFITDSYHTGAIAFNITGNNGYLYLSNGLGGVMIFSIQSDPSHPSLVGTLHTPGFANDAAVSDTFIYVADETAGVVVGSISDPSTPYIIDTFDSPGIAKGLFAAHPYVYVGDNDSFIILLFTDASGIDDELTPIAFELRGSYPNPFNAACNVEFSLFEGGHVSLDIYNLCGQKIGNLADSYFGAGDHSISWDASDSPSGVYFVKLTSAGQSRTIKATLLK